MNNLISEDFPLKTVGCRVYAKTQSSPIATASSCEIAQHISHVLNGYEQNRRLVPLPDPIENVSISIERIQEPYVRKHVDGPLLVGPRGQLHWLSAVDRLRFKLGLASATTLSFENFGEPPIK